ncbi:MAG: histidine phosphatase family protein, partial [Ruegeria sp.]
MSRGSGHGGPDAGGSRQFPLQRQGQTGGGPSPPNRPTPPSGWRGKDVSARFDADLGTLISDHAGTDVIVVARFGVRLSQVQRALGLTAEGAGSHRLDSLSVTTITRREDSWAVGSIN